MKTLVVEKSKIRANLETVKERAGKAQVIAVLKANAYGLGMREMAGLCREVCAAAQGLLAEAELLVLDDLGTELSTAFYQTALLDIINARLLAERPTIISTNLTPDEIGRRYARQIQSRLEGEYEVLPFFGEDIRKLKKR